LDRDGKKTRLETHPSTFEGIPLSVANFELSFGVVPRPSILAIFSGLGPLPV
jgi:hypothetical protein